MLEFPFIPLRLDALAFPPGVVDFRGVANQRKRRASGIEERSPDRSQRFLQSDRTRGKVIGRRATRGSLVTVGLNLVELNLVTVLAQRIDKMTNKRRVGCERAEPQHVVLETVAGDELDDAVDASRESTQSGARIGS